MSTYPPGYAAPDVPIFVPEADAISSFNTGSLAISAGGEILMNRSESEHAVLQFNKDTNGTDFINMGVRSITILDASGNLVPETETLCYTNADNKFDIIAVAGIQVKGVEDATWEGGSAIYATADAIQIPKLAVSSLAVNGVEVSGTAEGFLNVPAFQATTANVDTGSISSLNVSSINGISFTQPQASRVFFTGFQGIPNGITPTTAVSFSNQSFDFLNVWEASNPSTFTIQNAGYYRLFGSANFITNGVGARRIDFRNVTANNILDSAFGTPNSTNTTTVDLEGSYLLGAGVQVQMWLGQNSGAALSTISARWEIQRL